MSIMFNVCLALTAEPIYILYVVYKWYAQQFYFPVTQLFHGGSMIRKSQ